MLQGADFLPSILYFLLLPLFTLGALIYSVICVTKHSEEKYSSLRRINLIVVSVLFIITILVYKYSPANNQSEFGFLILAGPMWFWILGLVVDFFIFLFVKPEEKRPSIDEYQINQPIKKE